MRNNETDLNYQRNTTKENKYSTKLEILRNFGHFMVNPTVNIQRAALQNTKLCFQVS